MPEVLIMSWIFLIITVALNFFAHSLMIRQSNRQIKLLNQERYEGFPHLNEFNKQVVKTDKELNEIVHKGKEVNKAVITFLLLGLASLIIFGAANLFAINRTNKIQSREHYSHQALGQSEW